MVALGLVERVFAGLYADHRLYDMHVSDFITYIDATQSKLDADDAAPRTFRTISLMRSERRSRVHAERMRVLQSLVRSETLVSV